MSHARMLARLFAVQRPAARVPGTRAYGPGATQVPPGPAGYPAAQNEQWCAAAKFVSTADCAGTSDSTLPPSPNDGQGRARVDGLPLAAKLAQSARMLAASACWPALRLAGYGAFG